MNSKRLLSFVLASASALSSSLAAKRNFNNNLLGGYKVIKTSEEKNSQSGRTRSSSEFWQKSFEIYEA